MLLYLYLIGIFLASNSLAPPSDEDANFIDCFCISGCKDGHKFHKECLREYINSPHSKSPCSCPICRQDLLPVVLAELRTKENEFCMSNEVIQFRIRHDYVPERVIPEIIMQEDIAGIPDYMIRRNRVNKGLSTALRSA
jgi:Anaphase-promoting complex subunit 11 RING-H2 finger